MQAWLTRYRVIRRLVLGIATWMTVDAYLWGAWFATGNARDGLEIAAIIGAVTAPVAAYAGWVFKIYADSKEI